MSNQYKYDKHRYRFIELVAERVKDSSFFPKEEEDKEFYKTFDAQVINLIQITIYMMGDEFERVDKDDSLSNLNKLKRLRNIFNPGQKALSTWTDLEGWF